MNNKMKKLVAGLMMGTVLLTACSKPEGVAATVNGVDIPKEQFVENYLTTKNQIVELYGEDYLKEASADDPNKTMDEAFKENILNGLIQTEIVKQDADKEGATVDEATIDGQIEQVKESFGGDEAFQEALKEQDMTEEQYRELLSTQELMESYVTLMMEKLQPKDDKELEKYYEENKEDLKKINAAHILVETEEEAKEIKKQLADGGDFAGIAKEKSLDEGSKESGGELGFFGKGDMLPEFETAAYSLEKDEISEPVQSQHGYHIIKVLDFKDDFDSLKEDLPSKYVDIKFQEHLEKIEKDAKVKIYIDFKEEISSPEEGKEESKEAENKATNNEETKKDEPAAENQAANNQKTNNQE